jgi:hypothetical protein
MKGGDHNGAREGFVSSDDGAGPERCAGLLLLNRQHRYMLQLLNKAAIAGTGRETTVISC